jgi:hypothetical protein
MEIDISNYFLDSKPLRLTAASLIGIQEMQRSDNDPFLWHVRTDISKILINSKLPTSLDLELHISDEIITRKFLTDEKVQPISLINISMYSYTGIYSDIRYFYKMDGGLPQHSNDDPQNIWKSMYSQYKVFVELIYIIQTASDAKSFDTFNQCILILN